jgi:hypothetical protein
MQDIIIRNAIMTPDGTYLRSYHRHDYKEHKDKVTSEIYIVDGGNDYIRRSLNIVNPKDLNVYLNDSFENKIRFVFMWKSYGLNQEHAPKGIYIALCDMATNHIENILKTQDHIKDTYVEELFKKELNYRCSRKEGGV